MYSFLSPNTAPVNSPQNTFLSLTNLLSLKIHLSNGQSFTNSLINFIIISEFILDKFCSDAFSILQAFFNSLPLVKNTNISSGASDELLLLSPPVVKRRYKTVLTAWVKISSIFVIIFCLLNL